MPENSNPRPYINLLWNAFCLTSIAGIWPRFIEPNLLKTTHLNLPIPNLPKLLEGFKLLQISDLHLNPSLSNRFLNKLVAKASALKPDLIVFTGDFLCYAQLTDPSRLKALLNRFSAPYGCYAILGNHDYSSFVSINQQGDYDLIPPAASSLGRAFSRLTENITPTKTVSEQAKQVPLHSELIQLLKDTPFQLLHNQTQVLTIKGTKLNLTGLGEYMLGRLDAARAFQNYQAQFPGVVLLHNPDGVPSLKNYPGEVILCGHTHGGQVNLPWLWKKFTLLENMQFRRGLHHIDNKWVYVNRGLGGVLPFRWFSPPELTLLTLEQPS